MDKYINNRPNQEYVNQFLADRNITTGRDAVRVLMVHYGFASSMHPILAQQMFKIYNNN